jgi:flagellar hook-associated protein 3 FlgL
MQILKIRDQISELEDWENNLANAKDQLEMSYDTLTLVEENLQRINDLTVRLANNINSPETNRAIMAEINERAKTLQELANTQYEGDYIFGGSNTKNPPYALAEDMSITYSGSTHDQNWQKLLEVASGEELQTNVLGLDIFGDSTKGIFKAVKDLNTIAETEPIDVEAVMSIVEKEIQGSIMSITDSMSELGAYSSRADVAQSINEKMTVRLKENKTDLSETDLVQAASDLSLAQTSLKATLQVGAMLLGGASLLDYI